MTNRTVRGADGQQTRTDGHDFLMRSRAYITTGHPSADRLRHAPDLPERRSELRQPGRPAALSANRAFIQIAGFTFGLATSYFDFYSSAATSYLRCLSSDTGDGGWKVAAYTAQLGNGCVGVAVARRAAPVERVSTTDHPPAPTVCAARRPSDQIKIRWPDVVANLRVDQAWGSAQIMGALHDASGGYYGTTLTRLREINGHPDRRSSAGPSVLASRSTSR